MRMDTRTRRGPAARRRVPEERSAALQDVSRMGANNAAQEAIRVHEIFTYYFVEEAGSGVLLWLLPPSKNRQEDQAWRIVISAVSVKPSRI
ncbi:hypothetical protein J4Q44_G00323050 [Coregonus suidteri]|uniref:Uncharacterized protein n=1 Tax=Coregonus suidteri TaxID=861788 RepID=A0AAN8KS12_9TELE